MAWWMWLVLAVVVVIVGVVVYDLTQRRHALLRNYPVIGHFRYLLEGVGPELRQYIVVDNDAEKPFSRDQRRWIYTASKQRNPYFGFGTDNDLEASPGYLIVKQSSFPLPDLHPGGPGFDADYPLPAAKVFGGARARAKAVQAPSVVNVSAMSYGSLGAKAVESLNRGAALAGCWQGTGEGGICAFHDHGGDLVWQIGTGYFGCRDAKGRFDLSRFRDVVAAHPEIRMVEIKLSQGAKPGLGGLLPAAKVTPEIAAMRGIPEGVDCWSPSAHTAFQDVDGLLDFVELLAAESGLPVGHQVGRGPARPVPRPRRPHGDRVVAGSTSSPSTGERAGRVRGRSCSPTTSRCRSRSASRACTGPSRKPACTTTSCSPAAGSSVSPRTRCSRSRSAATR